MLVPSEQAPKMWAAEELPVGKRAKGRGDLAYRSAPSGRPLQPFHLLMEQATAVHKLPQQRQSVNPNFIDLALGHEKKYNTCGKKIQDKEHTAR